MSANSLLFWMSARTSGSWAQFRAAVEELHLGAEVEDPEEGDDALDQFALPLYQTLRFNLQRFGYAEFFAGAGGSDEWRVAPPTLALTRTADGWIGVAVGARSISLMDRLRSAVAGTSAKLHVLPCPSYPDGIVIAADERNTLAAIADKSRHALQDDAPSALLASLPPVDDPQVRIRTELPFGAGWRVDRFSTDDLAWHAATIEDARATSVGLFRFTLRHQRYTLFCCRGAAARIPGQVGKYVLLRRRRRNVLSYDSLSRTLSVPASCRLPFLIERALCLCSGMPPSYHRDVRQSASVNYSDIPEDIAALAAALLRQELR